MKSTFSIIFYLKRQVVKKDGTVPVMGRITVDGTQAQFSCKIRYSDKLYPNTCCLFLDAYCVGKHQILCKSSKFLEFLLASYGIFRKISYLCPRIKAFFAYCKIQKRAEVRSFPYCYLYNIGKRPTS